MARTVSLALVFGSVLLIGAAYATAFDPNLAQDVSPWLMVFGVAGVMVGMSMLGALDRHRHRGLALVFGTLFLILVVGFGAAILLPADDPAQLRLWLGLPPRAAIVVYGVGLLPLFFLPLAYALTFRDPVPNSEIIGATTRPVRGESTGESLDEVDDAGRGAHPVGAPTAAAPGRRRLETE